MSLFTLFLKSEKRSGFVFANTCYQKDINLPDTNKTGKSNFTGSQDIHGLLDSTDCTVKTNVSKQVLRYRIYHYRNVWRCMPREAKNKVQLTASARTATALAHTECHSSRRRWHSMATSCQSPQGRQSCLQLCCNGIGSILTLSTFSTMKELREFAGVCFTVADLLFSFYF